MQLKVYYVLLATILQQWLLEIHSDISKKIFQFFLVILQFFLSSLSFLLSLQTLIHKETSRLNLYCISYTLSFSYVIYYIVSEICIGGRFLEDCFYCYSQQIISAVAKGSLISYNLIQKVPETQNLYTVTPNATANQIKKI